MERVMPSVRLIASTITDEDEIINWLRDLNASEFLNNETYELEDNEILIELAARRCYKSFVPNLNPNITKIRKDKKEYFKNILSSGHGSVLEHATSTWAFENVSRVFTHELVRNRVGNAFSQESLRYVRLTDLSVWFPPEIAENPEAVAIFEETFKYLEKQQNKLAAIYDIDTISSFTVKKKLTSAFRRIAPIGLATGIVFTANMRSLRWIIEQRTNPAAEYEMRLVFGMVAERAIKEWPYLFQDFESISIDGLNHWKPQHSKV